MYLSVDGFQTLFDDGWHALKAGLLWRTDVANNACQQYYFVDSPSAKAGQQGADLARQRVILGDGAVWIWNMAKRLFPNAIQRVDTFHAASYLGTLAADAFGDGTPQVTPWFEHHKTLLLDGHLAALMHACRPIRADTRLPPTLRAPTLPITAPLRYPKYRALGFQIGSGVMKMPANKSVCCVSNCLALVGEKWVPLILQPQIFSRMACNKMRGHDGCGLRNA